MLWFLKKGTRCKNCTSREALWKRKSTLLKYLNFQYLPGNFQIYINRAKPYVIELINVMKSDAISAMMMTYGTDQTAGHNRELYTDALTGIYNRRYYEERIKIPIWQQALQWSIWMILRYTTIHLIRCRWPGTDDSCRNRSANVRHRYADPEWVVMNSSMPDITSDFADKLADSGKNSWYGSGYHSFVCSVAFWRCRCFFRSGSTENAIHKADCAPCIRPKHARIW